MLLKLNLIYTSNVLNVRYNKKLFLTIKLCPSCKGLCTVCPRSLDLIYIVNYYI